MVERGKWLVVLGCVQDKKGGNNVIDQRHVVEVMGSKHLIIKGTGAWTWMRAWV